MVIVELHSSSNGVLQHHKG